MCRSARRLFGRLLLTGLKPIISERSTSWDSPTMGGRSQRGYWVVKQKTASDRFSREVRSIDLWCQANRHLSIPIQQQKRNETPRRYYAYNGVTGNSEALSRLLRQVQRHWRKWRKWRKWIYRRNRLRSLNWTIYPSMRQRFPIAPVHVPTVHSVYRKVGNP